MLNQQQYEQLLKPLNASRVAKRQQAGRNLSYLEAWDVKAHLNRIFGFCNWSADVLSADLAFEEPVKIPKRDKQGNIVSESDGWNVGYKVVLRLCIGDHRGATYTEAAVGSATLPQRGEAHDMAVKTAESDALKRAAINLGTQFGLSLYDNGNLKDVIHMTLDRQQPDVRPVSEEPAAEETVPDNPDAGIWIESMKALLGEKDVPGLLELQKQMRDENVIDWTYQGVTLAKWLDKAIAQVGKN